ncbi:MAG: LytR family transcriptional regulator [Clostridiales bacterium]|nr:LytR family transcriptional regulator [Clostridiales bacterium]
MKRWIALLLALIVALGAVMAAGRMYVLWQGTPEGDETAQDEFENWPAQGDAAPDEDADYLDLLLDEETKNVLVQDEFRYQVADGDYSVTEGLDEDVMNILLLGTDSAAAVNAGRTDSMIVCSVNVRTGAVKLSSIVRDLYVQMPGMKSKNRINAANAFGGPNMAIKCVNEALNLNITRYISVNFTAFRELVDLVGGVEIELTSAEAREVERVSGMATKGGKQLLTGRQALEYCRIRKLDNNFGRNERQRKFLSAMVDKVMTGTRPEQLMPLAQTAMKYVSTNLSTSDVMTLLFTVVPNMKEMEMYSCPQNGEFHYEEINDASVVVGDLDKIRTTLHAFIYGE